MSMIFLTSLNGMVLTFWKTRETTVRILSVRLIVIAGTLSDPSVGNSLHTLQCLRARSASTRLYSFLPMFLAVCLRVFVQLVDLVVLHIDGNAADRIDQIRDGLKVYDQHN